MSLHHVFQFPNDNEATLEAVLRQMRCGAVTSPMGGLLTCRFVADAILIRCAFGKLRPASDGSLLVPEEEVANIADWLSGSLPDDRYTWASLERFEFFRQTDVQRLTEVFSDIVGCPPLSMPLTLWPEVFPATAAAPTQPAAMPLPAGGSPARA